MKLLKIALLTSLLYGCGGSESSAKENLPAVYTPPVMTATWSGEFSSWWERPQYYGDNKIPKYSGAMGTFPHKLIPMAVKSYHGDVFSIRTDNTEGDGNFHVYAMKNGVSVLVHTIEYWDDPHTNGIIYLDKGGYVYVRIASRGLSHKFQSGIVLKSQTPFELDFSCVEGCSPQTPNFEAYSQMSNTSWGEHLIYTKYEYDEEDEVPKAHRRLWSRIGDERVKLSNLARYNVSYYDSNKDELCVASNTLLDSSPDKRVNLSVICTEGGQDLWKLSDNSLVTFNDPSDPLETKRIVYETASKGSFIYLKDIISVTGKMRVLFTESTSDDPTKGTRYLKEWIQGEGVYTITEMGHNYSTGAYIKKDRRLYIVAAKSAVPYYMSGYLSLYNTDYEEIDTLSDGEYSFIKRVRYGNGEAVMSRGQSDLASRGEHYNLMLE